MPYYRAQGPVSLTAQGALCNGNDPNAVKSFCAGGHIPPTRFLALMPNFLDFFVGIPEQTAQAYYQAQIKNSGPQNPSPNGNGNGNAKK